MFDIAFSEVMIIAVVALIVIGPERLPRVARTLGHLFGRMQRYVNDVKADIQREVELDELRKLKQTVEESARSIEDSVAQEFNAAKDEMRGLESLAQAQAASTPTAPAAETFAAVEKSGATSSQPGAIADAGTPAVAAAELSGTAAAGVPAESGVTPKPAPSAETKAG